MTHTLVDHELGNDQEGQRHQEAALSFQVLQEGYGHIPIPHISFQDCEYQKRQPGDGRKDQNPFTYQRRCFVGQMRAPQKLEERPTQD
jgi:hypothetical protein